MTDAETLEVDAANAAVLEDWATALSTALSLAKAERLAELRGRRQKMLDERGLHQASVEWGRIFALEELVPGLSSLRDLGDPLCHPASVRMAGYREAEAEVEERIRSGEGWSWRK